MYMCRNWRNIWQYTYTHVDSSSEPICNEWHVCTKISQTHWNHVMNFWYLYNNNINILIKTQRNKLRRRKEINNILQNLQMWRKVVVVVNCECWLKLKSKENNRIVPKTPTAPTIQQKMWKEEQKKSKTLTIHSSTI